MVVISNLADFTALSPQEGYLHFSYYPFKEKTPNGNKKRVSFGLSSTLSSNKVLVHENEGQIVYSIA